MPAESRWPITENTSSFQIMEKQIQKYTTEELNLRWVEESIIKLKVLVSNVKESMSLRVLKAVNDQL